MGGPPAGTAYGAAPQGGSANLADILERVLDKGVVIAGDIQINLLDIELLTIKLRLLVASVDKAKEMGIDWWEHDPSLSSRARDDGPGRQMSAGHQGGRAQGAVADADGSSQSDEIARLRAEVAELRAASARPSAALPEGDGTRDGNTRDDTASEREPERTGRRPGTRSQDKAEAEPGHKRPRRRTAATSDDAGSGSRTGRSRPARRRERPDDAETGADGSGSTDDEGQDGPGQEEER